MCPEHETCFSCFCSSAVCTTVFGAQPDSDQGPISQEELQDEAMRVFNDEPMKSPKLLFYGLTRPLMSSRLDLGRIRVIVEEEWMG